VQVSGLPLICDADTGFGEGEMVSRTVVEYINAGAGGLHLEDQVFPKRCGHLDGKQLICAEDMVKKIRIAVEASKKHSNGKNNWKSKLEPKIFEVVDQKFHLEENSEKF